MYAAWLASGNILAWVTLVDPGLSTVLRQRVAVAYGRNDRMAIGEIVSAGLLISGGVIVLFIGGGIFLGARIPFILGYPTGVDIGLLIKAYSVAVLGAGFMVFSYSLVSIGKGLQSTLELGLILTSIRIVYLGVIILLLTRGLGIMALAYSQLFNGLTFTLLGALFLWTRLRREGIVLRFSIRGIHEFTGLLSFTFMGRVVSVVGANLDLVLTSRLLGLSDTSVLAFTRRVPETIRPLIARLSDAFAPSVSYLYGAGESDRTRAVLLRLWRIVFWLLGLFAVGFILLNKDFVSLWIGPAFYAGFFVNALICGGIVLGVLESSLNDLCFATGDVRGTSVVASIRGGICIALLFLLGSRWGMRGMVAAPLLAILLTSVWYLPQSFARRLHLDAVHRRNLITEIFRVLCAGISTGIIFAWFHVTTWGGFVLLSASVAVTYIGALVLLSAQFRTEAAGITSKVIARLIGHAS